VTADEVLARLRGLAVPSRLPGMARYGIATDLAYGVTVGELRALAREIGRDHDLAARLWDSGVHEARILASLLDDPALVDDAQFERWALGFDSWDLCDQVCQNLFRYAAGLDEGRRVDDAAGTLRPAGRALADGGPGRGRAAAGGEQGGPVGGHRRSARARQSGGQEAPRPNRTPHVWSVSRVTGRIRSCAA
jgi:hypothetical protein